MSGRAGRRGLDKKGVIILMIDEKIEPELAKAILKGKSDELLSSFYINYNMLLNAQRLEDIDPDYILARSFLQYQNDNKLPKILSEHKKKIEQYKAEELDNANEM
jgi:ATP-dependent RNA helicase DOB1